ncbi:hypothetical protein B9Z19DRAFT_1069783 [Tuber borchii]|uniref:Ubiquitin-like protease family profile domain-containing protein n=1 Tax=Tuber borchii TaxID=42251 RepID=A0A2T6ZA93_TUBBO|nr:hypothetical protein B9Z19DRAFT_1069783 [Tuber borchii]
MNDSITNPQVLAALARARKSASSSQSASKNSSPNLPPVSGSPEPALSSLSQKTTLVIGNSKKRKLSPLSTEVSSAKDLEIVHVRNVQQDLENARLKRENMMLRIKLCGSNAHINTQNQIWESTWDGHPVNPFPLQPPLLKPTEQEIIHLMTTIKNSTKEMLNQPALRTWDHKFSIQWKVLQELINLEKSEKTLDSVLDSWFSILFAASSPLFLSDVKQSFLPTLCSSFIGWTDEEYFETMVKIVCSEMIVDNYWHLLEVLYIPVCIPLNSVDDHWILLRVLIREEQSYIEVYDSLKTTLNREGKKQAVRFLDSLRRHSMERYIKSYPLEPRPIRPVPKGGRGRKSWIWRMPKEEHPKQGKNYDCGIFVMKSLELLVKEQPLAFEQKDIHRIRQEIMGIMFANMEAGKGWEKR